ncbi:MAG: hypothetical protein IJ775_00960 [Muribaculaceae bacterium]|nr:hypothetical protein [Muribaculaceae bacterium]
MKAWSFELRRTIEGVIVADRFTGTCSECHRKGDELATRLGDVECYAYNEPLNQWQKMGTYRGHYVFTDSFGDDRRIKWDYSCMAPMGKEVTV